MKINSCNEFLQKYRMVTSLGLNIPRPRVICEDGLSMSIQAGLQQYSTPSEDADVYSHVEIGYPSMLVDEILEYAEDKYEPLNTYYHNVPVEIVDKVIQCHGGIVALDAGLLTFQSDMYE